VKILPLLLALTFTVALADVPRVLPAGQLPDDARLAPLKDLDGYFPWTPPPTTEAWAKRADQVRRQMRVSLGLWPEPTRTPLNAVVHGKIERDDYTIEKVYFESMPGLFVTGSLFRPKNDSGKHPAVLCPHGHWTDARFQMKGDAEIKKEIAGGEERFERGGRSIFQSLGVQLARMGCVAFVIDMLGDSDSQQITAALSHKFGKQRPELITPESGGWGLYSPQAETYAQSIMGLHTWNNIRALDFLSSLPDVDAARLACTGASGGGTQTMILAALDPRLAVAVPCVMVSTAMQGGCTCENACNLRIGTGNIEFAALFAPKPMGLTNAKDWTLELPTKGFPDLQKHWAMMGAPDNLKLWAHPEFGHNYNIVTREHIYGFVNQHLNLGLPADRLVERDYELLTRDQLTVYDTAHPAPSGGPEFEKKLLGWWSEDVRKQLEKDPAAFKKIAQPALEALVGNALDGAGKAETRESASASAEPHPFSIINTTYHEQIPARSLGLKSQGESMVIALAAAGQTALIGDGDVAKASRMLAGQGVAVVALDLLMQGEFLKPGESDQPTRTVKNPREAAAYTAGYNHPLFVQRVQDVLTAVQWARSLKTPPKKIAIAATDARTAPIAAAAAALCGDAVTALALDTTGFRFQNVRDIRDPSFFPGGARCGDLPGLLALGAPRMLLLAGETAGAPKIVTAAYANTPGALHVSEGKDVDGAVRLLVEALR
jgi:dienelactone hydrolase